MNSGPKTLSPIERLAMAALVLIATAVGVQSLLHSVKKSEERTLNAAAIEYSTVRSMYAEPYQAHYSDRIATETTRADVAENQFIK
jgi:negative regulator of sigma E activity